MWKIKYPEKIDRALISTSESKNGIKAISDALTDIKPFRKYKGVNKKVSIEELEKLIGIIQTKYNVRIQWLSLTLLDNGLIWSVSVMTLKENDWIGSYQGKTIWEALAKGCISMMYLIEEGRIKVLDEVESNGKRKGNKEEPDEEENDDWDEEEWEEGEDDDWD